MDKAFFTAAVLPLPLGPLIKMGMFLLIKEIKKWAKAADRTVGTKAGLDLSSNAENEGTLFFHVLQVNDPGL